MLDVVEALVDGDGGGGGREQIEHLFLQHRLASGRGERLHQRNLNVPRLVHLHVQRPFGQHHLLETMASAMGV